MSIIRKDVERTKTVKITIVKCDFCGIEIEHDINQRYVPDYWGDIRVEDDNIKDPLSICPDCLKLYIKK